MNYNNEYDYITNKKEEVAKELKKLENNEIITKYFKLKEDYKYLLEKQKEMYKQEKIKEYQNCEHILITTNDNNSFENTKTTCNACIKCGLNDGVLKHEKENLSYQEQIMYEYLLQKMLLGTNLNINCEISFATSLYKKIKERNPNMDDNTIVEIFKGALDKISGNNNQKTR